MRIFVVVVDNIVPKEIVYASVISKVLDSSFRNCNFLHLAILPKKVIKFIIYY